MKKILLLALLLVAATGTWAQLNVTITGSTSGNPLSATITPTQPSCNAANGGSAVGSINLTPAGGSIGTGYTYLWSASNGGVVPGGQSTNEDLTALVPGDYSVTIMDANSCTLVKNATITAPTAISITPVTVANLTCNKLNGTPNGAIDVTVAGGAAPLSYAWTATGYTGAGVYGAATTDITGLNAATSYDLTVTDNNGCTKTYSTAVTEPTAVTAAVSTSSYNTFGVSCATGQGTSNNGTINLTVSNGVGTITYSWTGGTTSALEDLSGLSAGTYNVTATDNNGCAVSTSATLTAPAAISLGTTPTHLTCNAANGSATGAINLAVTNGIPTLVYAWSATAGGPVPGAQTAVEDLTTLPAGTYQVTVTDGNGCSATTSQVITQPAALTAAASVTSNFNGFGVSCATGQGTSNNGAIDLTVTGAVGTPTFAWTAPVGFTASSEDLTGLTARTYSVVVTDGTCTANASAIVTAPTAITLTASATVNDLCQVNAGAVTITAANGVAGYTLAWTPTGGSPSQPATMTGGVTNVTGLTGGQTYNFTVTDANGCHNN